MNILIDIGHPAHVHMFRNFAKEMQKHHKILFTYRQKECERQLLDAYLLPSHCLGTKKSSLIGKFFYQFVYEWRLFRLSKTFRTDLFLSHGSLIAAHVAWLLKTPHITFEDTFNAEQVHLYEPFVSLILTGKYPHALVSRKMLAGPFYNQSLYLHPHYFTPDRRIFASLGLHNGERYIVLRFVGWKATHDGGKRGISIENKLRLVKELSAFARIFICSENALPTTLQRYALPCSPVGFHHVLAFAALVLTEGTTTAAEAALLATPNIVINNANLPYINQLQKKYRLTIQFPENVIDKVLAKSIEFLEDSTIRQRLQKSRNAFLQDHIDATKMLCWLAENYPESEQKLRYDDTVWWNFR